MTRFEHSIVLYDVGRVGLSKHALPILWVHVPLDSKLPLLIISTAHNHVVEFSGIYHKVIY